MTGALNQQLALLRPFLNADDVVLVMDADSTISPEFLETALDLLEADADLMAVGGLFFGAGGSWASSSATSSAATSGSSPAGWTGSSC